MWLTSQTAWLMDNEVKQVVTKSRKTCWTDSSNKFSSEFELFFVFGFSWAFPALPHADMLRITPLSCVTHALVCCRTSSDMPDVLSRRKLKQSPSDQDLPWRHRVTWLTKRDINSPQTNLIRTVVEIASSYLTQSNKPMKIQFCLLLDFCLPSLHWLKQNKPNYPTCVQLISQ